jgi:hypothetical protein
MSLSSPVEFDVEKFGYEEDEDSIEDGYIFGLIRGEVIGNHYIKEGVIKSHYRVKKNLGSKLEKVDFSQVSAGIIKLTYKDGDVCGTKRYKTQIQLLCEVSEKTSAKLEQLPSDNDSILH